MPGPDLSRVAVVGTSCAGKTTLARALAGCLSAPHIELDALHWLPGWQAREAAAFRALVDQATAMPRWVACGNYATVRDLVWARATTMIWLNYGFARVLSRGLGRTLIRCLTREELYSNNRETFRQAFFSRQSILWWIVTSYGRRKGSYRDAFESGALDHLTMLEFRRPHETRRFLESL